MDLHYNAFISYRHAPLDIKIAAEIQRSLERYPVPKEIQKQTGRRKIERVFRDKEELPITSDLNDDISQALRHSDFLIVICSTNTASSVWVRREIETFLQNHDRHHVLTVLADGEPQDVIPDLLRYEEIPVQGSDGTTHTERREIEPLSCDYRLRRSRARREELPRLAAALLGCAYDELRQRQRRHRVRQMVAGFTAALVLVSAVAAYAVNRAYVIARQAEQIEEEYRNTLISQSRYLAEKSGELLAQGDRMGALQVALAALPESEADDSRPLVTEALFALNNAVYPYHIAQPDEFLAKCMLQTDGNGNGWDDRGDWQQVSPGGTRWMITDKSGQLYLFDMEKDARIAALSPQTVLPGTAETRFLSADFLTEDRIVLYLESCAVCWDLQAGGRVWQTPLENNDPVGDLYAASQSMVDPAGGTLVFAHTGYTECTFYRLDAATGAILATLTGEMPPGEAFICCMALSPNGSRMALGFAENRFRTGSEETAPAYLMLADFSGGVCRGVPVEHTDVAAVTFQSDDRLCVFTVDTGIAGYLNTDFDYAVACFSFDEDEPVWSSAGRMVIDRSTGDEAKPSCSLRMWVRDVSDGGTEELLIAQFAGRMLLLAPEDGAVLRTADFAADILSIYPYSAGQLYLALRNGQLMVYLPVAESFGEMGRVAETLRSAAFDREMGTFLLALEDSRNTVVMSNQMEDPGLATLEFDDIESVEYAFGDGWEYRIVQENMPGSGGESSNDPYGAQRLLFYLPLAETPFAVTDPGSRILDFAVVHSEDGEDVCYYLLEREQTRLLCGWGLESDQKVFEYELGRDAKLLGVSGGGLVYLTQSSLRFLDPADKTEQSLALESSAKAQTVSPDGKYLALMSETGLALLDLERWTWVELPGEVAALHCGSTSYSGSLSFSPGGDRLAVWTDEGIEIIALDTLSVDQRVQIACRSCGYSLFLNDRILLVYGDAGHLTTWDLAAQAVVMEDPSDDVSTGAGLLRGDGCFQVGNRYPRLYRYSEDGQIARYLAADYACISPSGTEILSFYNKFGAGSVTQLIADTAFRIYPMYSLDELVAKGMEILDGRTLTEAERLRYFIDS